MTPPSEAPREAGFRCNCPGCDGRARLPCEAIQEFESLRAKVKELEGDLKSECEFAVEAHARIRELEEAMPDVNSLKGWATVAHYTCMDSGLEMALNAMVNRIEKVMKR